MNFSSAERHIVHRRAINIFKTLCFRLRSGTSVIDGGKLFGFGLRGSKNDRQII